MEFAEQLCTGYGVLYTHTYTYDCYLSQRIQRHRPQTVFETGQNKDGKLNFTLFNNTYNIVCSHNINHIAARSTARHEESEGAEERGGEGERESSQPALLFCVAIFFLNMAAIIESSTTRREE